jgi:non-specific serine/threonine protein kinase
MPILEGLAQIHSASCYHLDISNDNIVVLDDGSPVLLDFGAARYIEWNQKDPSTIILKPGFAPIEQYSSETEGLKLGPWSDIYSISAVVYQLVSGKMPAVSITRIIRDDLPPLVGYATPDLPAEVLAIIDVGMAVEPKNRPQTIEAFADALKLAGQRKYFVAQTAHFSVAPPPSTLPGDPSTLTYEVPVVVPFEQRVKETLIRVGATVKQFLHDVVWTRLASDAVRLRKDALAAWRGVRGLLPGSKQVVGEPVRLVETLRRNRLGVFVLVVGVLLAFLAILAFTGGGGSPDVPAANKQAVVAALPVTTQITQARPAPVAPLRVAPVQVEPVQVEPTRVEPSPPVKPAPTAKTEAAPQVQAKLQPQVKPQSRSASAASSPGGVASNHRRPTSEASRQQEAAVEDVSGFDVKVEPWGHVYLDGKRIGTPPPTIRQYVPPGTYRLEIRNEIDPPVVRQITVEAGKMTSVTHKFEKQP